MAAAAGQELGLGFPVREKGERAAGERGGEQGAGVLLLSTTGGPGVRRRRSTRRRHGASDTAATVTGRRELTVGATVRFLNISFFFFCLKVQQHLVEFN